MYRPPQPSFCSFCCPFDKCEDSTSCSCEYTRYWLPPSFLLFGTILTAVGPSPDTAWSPVAVARWRLHCCRLQGYWSCISSSATVSQQRPSRRLAKSFSLTSAHLLPCVSMLDSTSTYGHRALASGHSSKAIHSSLPRSRIVREDKG